jgi:hypothetical protein
MSVLNYPRLGFGCYANGESRYERQLDTKSAARQLRADLRLVQKFVPVTCSSISPRDICAMLGAEDEIAGTIDGAKECRIACEALAGIGVKLDPERCATRWHKIWWIDLDRALTATIGDGEETQ